MKAVGRYRVERQLGAGAFATVWLARDDDLDVPVAIKVLAENWAHNVDVRRRFVEEARLLRQIGDSRVVGVHDIGTLADQRPYFVMDYADAGTVADLVGAHPDPGTALAVAVEVARAVQVLHDNDVLHRDVKPSNLLLRRRRDGSDQLMIADLGTAKALAEASGLTLAAGTPAYMAPEQAHGQRPLDVRADVYGIAAVAYALVGGGPPFPAVVGVSDVAFRDPELRPARLDVGRLDDVLRRGLAFDPDDRPRTAADLADQLDELRGDLLADTAVRLTRVEPTPPPVSAPRSRLLPLALTVVVLVAAITWLALGLLD